MPVFSSIILLRQLQQQTEYMLETVIAQWQLIPHTRFAKRPSAESWSANECVQHLNSYHAYYLPAIEKAMEKGMHAGANLIFKTGWLGNYFTNLMMVTDRPIKKMKSPKDHAPGQIIESHQVIGDFIDHQERLLKLLHRAAEMDMNRIRIPVSISKIIRLKLGDIFRFLIAHEIRHFIQAQKAFGSDANLPEALSRIYSDTQ